MRVILGVAGVLLAAVSALVAQSVEPGATHRVFLKDGQSLPSYGESVVVEDRVVFTLLVSGTAGRSEMQLMSLPAASVDLERTNRYADAMRAAHYAATRGEADYVALTEEVDRAVERLKSVEDPKRRLELAEEARRRLLQWSSENYHYRAADVQVLAGLLDEVVAELRSTAGESQIAIDLHAGPIVPEYERVVAPPGLRESIALALGAARAADVGEDRTAILRSAAALLDRESGVDDLKTEVKRQLDEELSADAAYTALSSGVLAAAEKAMQRGDVAAVGTVRATVTDRDRALGNRRPQQVQSLMGALQARLEATQAYRLVLDHYAMVRRSFFDYERRVRPAFSTLDGLKPILEFIRDLKGMAYERLETASARLKRVTADLAAIEPPADLADIHATLASAVNLAANACANRRLAVATTSMQAAKDASTAAVGAELLAGQAREQLVKRLYPPTFAASGVTVGSALEPARR